jgi:hypothetical protein
LNKQYVEDKMIKAIFTSMVLAFLGGVALSQISSGEPVPASGSDAPVATKASPFACNRLALTAAQRQRQFGELGPTLRSMRKSVQELPDGYDFEFPADPATVQLVAEWASGERLCCPFFEIQLRLEPEGGPLWLRLTGRSGTKEFIKADAAAWVKP